MDFKYDKIDDFQNGVAKVYKNMKWGVIDKNGKEVLECEVEDSNIADELVEIERLRKQFKNKIEDAATRKASKEDIQIIFAMCKTELMLAAKLNETSKKIVSRELDAISESYFNNLEV